MANLDEQSLNSLTSAIGSGPTSVLNSALGVVVDITTPGTYTTDIYVNSLDANSVLATSFTGNMYIGYGSVAADASSTYLWVPSADTWQFNAATNGAVTVTGSTGANGIIFGASGRRIGFYGIGPVARPSAYTQTYSTATKTHSNPTATALTVTDGVGTNDGTIGAITNNATTITAVQELAAAINALIVDVANTKGVLNSAIDDLQALGLLQ